jgi:hypothetical protein
MRIAVTTGGRVKHSDRTYCSGRAIAAVDLTLRVTERHDTHRGLACGVRTRSSAAIVSGW